MKRDILCQTKAAVDCKLVPGDSRFLEHVPTYNDPRVSASQSYTGWHHHEINHDAGEAFAMDVWNSPVIAAGPKKYRYVIFFVCIVSNYIVDVPLENLKAESIVSSIYYLINYIKIRFGKKLRAEPSPRHIPQRTS